MKLAQDIIIKPIITEKITKMTEKFPNQELTMR